MSTEPAVLRQRLLDSPILRAHIVSIIWIGSLSRSSDVHDTSDLDIQIILDRPNLESTQQLARVLDDYPNIDLSIVYRPDIFDSSAHLDFQDGTKGPFFIQVLADGILLHGEDLYRDVASTLSLAMVRPSLMFTIREYISRLRVMATRGGEPSLAFKKYCVKLLKDVLVHDGRLALVEMTRMSNGDTLELVDGIYQFNAAERALLHRLTDLRDLFGSEERAVVLCACERLVENLRHVSS